MRKSEEFVLKIKGLTYKINQIEILRNIDLKVKKGEFVGLIGPNGAGKTTVLKCINRINKGSGEIQIMDNNIKKLSDKKIAREIALMHQNTSVTFPFPALDIVMMGRYPYLKRTQGEQKEDFKIARDNMNFTDTVKFEKKPITHISGGERQRVFYAKVLTQETGIMLLDEPTASLDITHQEQIFKYSKELCEAGKTVIAAVHDLRIASRYCTRLVLMESGNIIADGKPEDVLTSENIYKAYGVKALVYKNSLTGLIDIHIREHEECENRRKVHIIGGGDSAAEIMRYLYEKGYELSAGVLNHGDSDLKCAEAFAIDSITSQPFSEISRYSQSENIKKIKNSDITILCDMPFGIQNLNNLEAAKYAKNLIIIEDSIPESRDFTGGKALKLYGDLREKGKVITSDSLHKVI